jgi:hypothetical protein
MMGKLVVVAALMFGFGYAGSDLQGDLRRWASTCWR